jgi:hypothetical protein
VDYLLLSLYLIALVLTRHALAPLLAFGITMYISSYGLPTHINHIAFSAVYLFLIPMSNVRVGYGMLASSIANAIAVGYFLSPVYFNSYPAYFLTVMTVVNLYILLTCCKAVRDGELFAMDDLVYTRVMDTCNFQTSTKACKRG